MSTEAGATPKQVPDLAAAAAILGEGTGPEPIRHLLAAVGEGMRVERVHLTEFVNQGRHVDGAYEWNASGSPQAFPDPRRLPVEAFPWWMTELRTGGPIRITNPEDVPVEATAERQLMEESGARAMLALPLEGPSLGLLGFLAVVQTSGDRIWTDQEAEALVPAAGLLGQRIECLVLLREREALAERLAQVEAAGQAGAWEFDPESGFTFWSQEAHRILQLSGYLPNPTLFDFLKRIHPADRERTRRVILQILDDDRSFSLEYRLVPADGSEAMVRYVGMTGEVVYRKNDGRRIIGSLRDLTLPRKLEEELTRSQRMETVGKLAGGIAHDFNGLLSVIQANAELLLATGAVAGEAAEDLQQILAAARSGATLTDKLLSFVGTRSRTGGPVEANWVIRGVERILSRLLPEEVRLIVSTDAEVGLVAMDGSELEQAVMNLALNAREAMEGKGGVIRIRSRRLRLDTPRLLSPGHSLNAGDYAVVSVEDDGQGIESHILSRIFEPFFTTRTENEGRGLGLATTYGMVQQAGGGIEVETEPGRGSVFHLYFPTS